MRAIVLAAVTMATLIDVSICALIGCVEDGGMDVCFDETSDVPLKWMAAKAACEAKGEKLATPTSPQADQLLRSYLKRAEENSTSGLTYSAWIGAVEDVDGVVWRWMHSGSAFRVGENDTTVVGNFSQVGRHFENCALASRLTNNRGVQFKSQLCRRPAHFICQYNATGDGNCKQATDVKVGAQCYWTSTTDPVTWFDAVNTCTSKGSRLAEMADLANWTSVVGEGKYWVGLRRQPWVWAGAGNATKTDVAAFHWMEDGQPDLAVHDCVAYAASPTDVGWKADNCAAERSYICENSRPVTTIALLLTTSGAKNQTAVIGQNKSPFVLYILPATLMIGAFILFIIMFIGCFVYKRRTKGYQDITK